MIFAGTGQSKAAATAKADSTISLALLATLIFFVGSGYVSYWNTKVISQNTQLVTHTHEVITAINRINTGITDAETGQRGFIITGQSEYLNRYDIAAARLPAEINALESLIQDNPVQIAHVKSIRENINIRLDELRKAVLADQEAGFEAAQKIISSNRGKGLMDAIRGETATMISIETGLRQQRFAEMEDAYRIAIISGFLICLLGVCLSILVALMLRRAARLRQHQDWLRTGESRLNAAMLGDQRIETLADNILKFFAEYFDVHAGAFYTRNQENFKLVSTYGVPADGDIPETFVIGDGLLGQSVKENKSFFVNDVPEGYLTIGSALGKSVPRHLVIFPVSADGVTNAVIELGFIHSLGENSLELLNKAAGRIGVAVQSASYRAHLQNLLEETQRQSEELQAQSEELRVSNEELEEQSRALKESQSRLEQQQAELEQTNSQLEEQTQLLELQKEDLSRTKNAVQLKAQELERASQYKSDFLANMSHELRTPLNSSLILSKLLSDNAEGNLTEEQVKFARTIQNSGNYLLSLINDILDLSKIEAGHMEIHAETTSVNRFLKELTQTFEPLTQEKGLKLIVTPGDCPATIVTDKQRLEQIVKNLMSNAIKFTEKGSVELRVETQGDNIAFHVIDTGIGIADDQQENIFEAFRQADGTISRKYGGTGLGLSISRELTRLLGGKLTLTSKPGHGSTFTIVIPRDFDPAKMEQPPFPTEPVWEAPVAEDVLQSSPPRKTSPPVKFTVGQVKDDRDTLQNGDRCILVIEDDESFAQILYSLTHELNFKCIIATTAEESLALAQDYKPNAVVLDVGLPDNSGLSVLDRLKRDPKTRHIPVHVVSANDYSRTALSLGAVGYMIKPVKRTELVEALKRLETRFSQHMNRVLIVEDDEVQRESLCRLLGSHEVQTVAVGTAAECLEKLRETTFDCMVLDLSLPDATGYSLLETLSQEEDYAFPPVIVYTGRDLSHDDEHRLRKYSKSIIIKGAKSPERLLDEVTLFLHQVISDLPPEQQKMLEKARNRDAILENRRILVVEDDVANIYALTSILEPHGARIEVARNGREALEALEESRTNSDSDIDMVLMDMMMPEMDGLTATRLIRQKPEHKKLPIIMLTAKAMRDDQERCLEAGANDYMAKPLDVEKLLSLVRVWMPR